MVSGCHPPLAVRQQASIDDQGHQKHVYEARNVLKAHASFCVVSNRLFTAHSWLPVVLLRFLQRFAIASLQGSFYLTVYNPLYHHRTIRVNQRFSAACCFMLLLSVHISVSIVI